MDIYQEKLVRDYWDITREINDVEPTIEHEEESIKRMGEERYGFTKKRYEAMLAYQEALRSQITEEKLWDKPLENEAMSHEESSNSDYIDREMVITHAFQQCLRKLYKSAQPSGDYDEYVRMTKVGELTVNDEYVYNRHYLPETQYNYIVNQFLEAYGMTEKWHDNVETVIDYFKDGSPSSRKDENGFYIRMPHMKDEVKDLLKENGVTADPDALAEKIYDAFVNRINECKNFFRFDREETSFRWTVGNYAPTINKEIVKKYWEKHGKEIVLVDPDPETLWEKDYYGEEYDKEE